jgi:dihydrofolate reductase
VTEGIDTALERARAAAGGRDVRVAGGASVVRQAIDKGLVDELILHLASVLLGGGVRLFDAIDADKIKVQGRQAIVSPLATHLYYDVIRVMPRDNLTKWC